MQTRTSQAFAPLDDLECRDSGAEAGAFTIKGHAAVFNRPCDFGYFTEYVAPGAFRDALNRTPLEVLSVWDHDTRYILGSTLNGTLDLAEDEDGLMQWTRVAPTSYAADLRILVDRGDIQQCSFMFTINDETWEYADQEGDEQITVTINEIGTLYDVTVCGRGAYPQTDVSVASRSRLDSALRQGRVPGLTLGDARERGILGSTDDSGEAARPSESEVVAAAQRLRATEERGLRVARARAQVEHARAMLPKG